MTPEETKQTYIAYRLKRASESLQSARILVDAGMYYEAISRMYYACFYAVNALLYQHDMGAKRHSGVQSLFNKHFVRTQKVSRELANLYNDLFDLRLMSDYQDLYHPDPQEIMQMLPQVEAFIETIQRLVESGSGEGS
ncbi:MAG: HEPN domain-containing protein [Fimbriimonadales bacterium]